MPLKVTCCLLPRMKEGDLVLLILCSFLAKLFYVDCFYYKATRCFSLSALGVVGDLHLRAVECYPTRGSALQLQMLNDS